MGKTKNKKNKIEDERKQPNRCSLPFHLPLISFFLLRLLSVHFVIFVFFDFSFSLIFLLILSFHFAQHNIPGRWSQFNDTNMHISVSRTERKEWMSDWTKLKRMKRKKKNLWRKCSFCSLFRNYLWIAFRLVDI